jgi:hypothetical protein
MFKISRREIIRRTKKAVKYSLFLAACYWVVDFHNQWDDAAEARAIRHKKEGECSKKLAGMEQVPILGGSYLDRTRIPGFHFGSRLKGDGSCIADLLEGAFWWTGTELITAYDQVGKEPSPDWGFYKVAARLYTRTEHNEPHTMGYRHKDWPDDLIVKLKNYPGLELWLDAPPPHFKNEYALITFVMSDWRRRDGTPRLISCAGLNSASDEVAASGLSQSELLTFSRAELENVDFGRLNTRCSVQLHSFDFAGGDGRVSLGTSSLRGAPEALRFVSEYLSSSIITRK